MFALFEITDKGSSWLGPLVASLIVQTTGSIRPVLLYLLCAMVAPAIILHFLELKTAQVRASGASGMATGAAADSAALVVDATAVVSGNKDAAMDVVDDVTQRA